MDLGLSLPADFDRAFLWNHLAAMVEFKCAAGLDTARMPALNDARRSGQSEDPEQIIFFLQTLHDAMQNQSLTSETLSLASSFLDHSNDIDSAEVHEVTIDSTFRITRYGFAGRLVPQPTILSDEDRELGKVDDNFRVYWAIFDFLMCQIEFLSAYEVLLQFRTHNLAAVIQINDTIRRARTPATTSSPTLPILILISKLLRRYEVGLQAVWVPFEECVKAGQDGYMEGTEMVWDIDVYTRMRVDKKARGITARGVFGEAENVELMKRLRQHEKLCERDH